MKPRIEKGQYFVLSGFVIHTHIKKPQKRSYSTLIEGFLIDAEQCTLVLFGYDLLIIKQSKSQSSFFLGFIEIVIIDTLHVECQLSTVSRVTCQAKMVNIVFAKYQHCNCEHVHIQMLLCLIGLGSSCYVIQQNCKVLAKKCKSSDVYKCYLISAGLIWKIRSAELHISISRKTVWLA